MCAKKKRKKEELRTSHLPFLVKGRSESLGCVRSLETDKRFVIAIHIIQVLSVRKERFKKKKTPNKLLSYLAS
jgi:hypothetical protein